MTNISTASECTDRQWEFEIESDGDVTTEEWEDIIKWCEPEDSNEQVDN